MSHGWVGAPNGSVSGHGGVVLLMHALLPLAKSTRLMGEKHVQQRRKNSCMELVVYGTKNMVKNHVLWSKNLKRFHVLWSTKR